MAFATSSSNESQSASSSDHRTRREAKEEWNVAKKILLHGGRPGNELAGAGMAAFVADAMESGTVPPAIYVFVNGGPLSHYNYPHDTAYGSSAKQGMGCDVFINELIPHIDGEALAQPSSSLCCPRPRRHYRLGEPPAG